MFKTYDDRSGCYRGTLDQSSVHGLGVVVCCPAFCAKTSGSIRSRMAVSEHTSLESAIQCCAH